MSPARTCADLQLPPTPAPGTGAPPRPPRGVSPQFVFITFLCLASIFPYKETASPFKVNSHTDVSTHLTSLTLPSKAQSVVSLTSQCSYSSTIVHVGDKKPQPELGTRAAPRVMSGGIGLER